MVVVPFTLSGNVFLTAAQLNVATIEMTEQNDGSSQVNDNRKLAEKQNLSFFIAAKDKKISIREIMREISAQLGIEIRAPIRGRERIQLQLDRPRARLAIVGLNFFLNPAIDLGLPQDGSGVRVSIDERRLKEQFKTMIRDENAWTREMGLKVVSDIDPKQAKRLVVLIHGYQSDTEGFEPLIRQIEHSNRNLPVATFKYPSRRGVSDVTDQLAHQLREIVGLNQELKVTLVTHSMGGIIARNLIEVTNRDFSAIDSLIMVAPPNHGSELARVGMSGNAIETLVATIERERFSKFVLGLVESVDQAAGDMVPGSELIQELNRKSRNTNVKYSIILGNKSFLSEAQANVLTAGLSKVKLGSTRFLADSMKQLKGELVDEKGDGVVSLESGKLEGVKDIHVMSFSHNDILNCDAPTQEAIIEQIIKRIDIDKLE